MGMIRVENLVKQYQNGVQALNGLSLNVREGEIFTLLGQNGAGKSTLINILTTYLRPSSGKVEMFGKSIYGEAAAIRREIACVAQRTSIDTYLSLTENMMFQSQLYKIPKAKARERMKDLITCFGLERYLKYPVVSYSGGVKRRLDIALNLMSGPRVLFLDEPTVGMDIQSRQAMWEMMNKVRDDFGTTIFLTTHYLEEADRLSDTICIMKEGKEVAQGSPEKLRSYLRRDFLKITLESRQTDMRWLSELFPKRGVDCGKDEVIIPTANARADLSMAVRFLVEREIAFTGIEIMKPAIEDIFIHLTGTEEVTE